MGKDTKIQWCHHSFNPWIGCQKVGPACTHCYAAESTFVRVQRSEGRELWGNELRSERHVTSDANWKKPLRWNAEAEESGERHRVFCASLADVFEDREELGEPRDRLWDLIERTPALDWLLLTKRPENVMGMVPPEWRDRLPESVWLGTSVGNQEWAEKRIPHLLQCPAAVRFLSCEPLLGPVDLSRYLNPWQCQGCWEWRGRPEDTDATTDGDTACPRCGSTMLFEAQWYPDSDGIHWVIIGGESGPNARPCNAEWIRSLLRQCREAGVAGFVKQLGAEAWDSQGETTAPAYSSGGFPIGKWRVPGKVLHLDDRKGGDPSEWPEDLRVREFPEASHV